MKPSVWGTRLRRSEDMGPNSADKANKSRSEEGKKASKARRATKSSELVASSTQLAGRAGVEVEVLREHGMRLDLPTLPFVNISPPARFNIRRSQLDANSYYY